MSIGGALNLNAGGLFVANCFDAARGSVANDGTVSIGGDAGTASLVLIGSVFPINPPAQVGNTAIGSVTIGNGDDPVPGALRGHRHREQPTRGCVRRPGAGHSRHRRRVDLQRQRIDVDRRERRRDHQPAR